MLGNPKPDFKISKGHSDHFTRADLFPALDLRNAADIAEICDRTTQAIFELNRWLPAECRLRKRDIGAPLLRVVRGQGIGYQLA